MVLILIAIVTLLIGPILNFFIGWVSGWLVQNIFGTWITNLLTYFNVNLPIEQLPFLFGFVAMMATFFTTMLRFDKKE